jgi:hypothetical protein
LLLTPAGLADEEDYFDREDDDDDGERDAAPVVTPAPSASAPTPITTSREDGPLPNGTVAPHPEIGPALPAALSVLSEYGQDDDEEEQEDEDDGSPGAGAAHEWAVVKQANNIASCVSLIGCCIRLQGWGFQGVAGTGT